MTQQRTTNNVALANAERAELHSLRKRVSIQQQELAALRIQRDLALALSTATTLDEALNYVLDAVLLLDEIDCGGVYLADRTTNTFELIAHRGISPTFAEVVSHLSADSHETQLILQGKPIYHFYTDLLPNLTQVQRDEGLQAIAVLPVYEQGKLVAALNVGSHIYSDIPIVQRAALEAIATQIGSMIARLETASEHRRIEEAYRSLVEYSLQALAIFQDNRIVFANPMMSIITGYSLEALLAVSVEEIYAAIYAEDRARVWANMQARQAGKTEPAHYTFRLTRQDGMVRWVEVSSVVITYRNKPAIQITFIDITEQKHTEEALYRSQALLTGVLDYSPVAIYIKDTHGRFLLVNQRAAEIIALERDQIVGKNEAELFSPEFAAQWKKNIQYIQQTGKVLEKEDVFPQPDGLHTYLSIAFPLYDAQGTITMVGGISTDITERVRAEEANRCLVEHSLQGLAIYQHERILFANPRMAMIVGYSIDELLALSVEAMAQIIHPDYREQVRTHILDILANKPTPPHIEYPIIRKDGEIRWVESYTVQIAYRDKTTLQVALIDLTERRRAEESLRESEERYRMLVETSPSAILLTNHDGTIRFCNHQAAMLFGYATTDELIGKYSPNLIAFDTATAMSTPAPATNIPPTNSPDAACLADTLTLLTDTSAPNTTRFMGHVQQIIETGTLRNMEYTLHRQDGSRFPAEVNSSVFTDPQGNPTGFMIMVQDISERKKLQAQLIQNERFAASGRLATSVAHEINTPLQSLQNSLSLIRKMEDRQHRDTFLALAQEEIERVGKIVHQLLDFYRPAATTGGVFHINTLIERILLLLGKQFKDHGIEVQCHLQERLPLLHGRADELSQVLINLCVNAAEAMPSGGTLTVHTQRVADNDKIAVTLRDTGSGIAPNLLAQIFDPFVTTKEQGTGLGLAISKNIVAQHGGSIEVESVLGSGSLFRVILPT